MFRLFVKLHPNLDYDEPMRKFIMWFILLVLFVTVGL